MAAIGRDQLSGAALVPLSVIGKGENSTPGSVGLASCDGVGVDTLVGQAASCNLSTIGLMQSSG